MLSLGERDKLVSPKLTLTILPPKFLTIKSPTYKLLLVMHASQLSAIQLTLYINTPFGAPIGAQGC